MLSTSVTFYGSWCLAIVSWVIVITFENMRDMNKLESWQAKGPIKLGPTFFRSTSTIHFLQIPCRCEFRIGVLILEIVASSWQSHLFIFGFFDGESDIARYCFDISEQQLGKTLSWTIGWVVAVVMRLLTIMLIWMMISFTVKASPEQNERWLWDFSSDLLLQIQSRAMVQSKTKVGMLMWILLLKMVIITLWDMEQTTCSP